MARYRVVRMIEAPAIDAKWDKPAWRAVKPLKVELHMGERPAHVPVVQAKAAWDDTALYVIFRVEDRYVLAVTAEPQGSVCRDSCAEFFFTPGVDVSKGYFNIEINCGGVMLFHFQTMPRQGNVPIPEADFRRVDIAHTMPRFVDPEVTEPVTWVIEYRVPLAVLEKYAPVTRPAPGVIWRANFYKCADKTSHPHWLTWSPVARPRPDFHVPTSFGELEFVER